MPWFAAAISLDTVMDTVEGEPWGVLTRAGHEECLSVGPECHGGHCRGLGDPQCVSETLLN